MTNSRATGNVERVLQAAESRRELIGRPRREAVEVGSCAAIVTSS